MFWTWHFLFLIPIGAACGYWIASAITLSIFLRKQESDLGRSEYTPFVSLVKPVYGLEKDLKRNLETACLQAYPNYEVVYALQRPSDPALPLVQEIVSRYPDKARWIVDETAIGPNGRLCNIYNGTKIATGEVLVFSDSDMCLDPSYLRIVVAPLVNRHIGVSCTLYKVWEPKDVPEALEMLALNTDFVPAMVFATVTKLSIACPGASQAIRRVVLEEIGGLAPMSHYLVEDFELGRRVAEKGYQIFFSPHIANTGVDLQTVRDWWRHQVYWDQNTRAANPSGFFGTLLIRGIPFAFLYTLFAGPFWFYVLTATVGVRILTAFSNAFWMRDWDALRWLWLLPLRDLVGLATWFCSFTQRTVFWKGKTFAIQKGQMVEMHT